MTDDELFQALSRALASQPRQPTAASVFTLRRAVIERRPARSSPARSSPASWRRRLMAVVVLVPVVLGVSTAAYALSGAPLPEPVRAAANAVGLPVDSVAVANVRAASAKLKDGLREHDHAGVDAAARRLRAQLSHLSADDRHRVEPAVNTLLGEADLYDAQHDDGRQDARGGQDSPPTTAGTSGTSGTSSGSHGTSGGGQDSPSTTGTSDPGSRPATGSGGQDDSPAPTGPSGNMQDNSPTTATNVPGGAGQQNSHQSPVPEG